MQIFQREQMVEQQVRTWEVLDPAVLDVMQNIPREHFLPEKFKLLANSDTAFNIRPDFMLPSPSVQGRILQALEINDNDSILQIGAGCGYLTACLRQLGGDVTVIDANENMLNQVKESCEQLNINGIKVLQFAWDDVMQLNKKQYDIIVSQFAIEDIPDNLFKALKPQGRAVLFTGTAPVIYCYRIERINEKEFQQEAIFETLVSPYPAKAKNKFKF
jgi:protein-L-isoaspartate(D-aspartate) O-methyltransferase